MLIIASASSGTAKYPWKRRGQVT